MAMRHASMMIIVLLFASPVFADISGDNTSVDSAWSPVQGSTINGTYAGRTTMGWQPSGYGSGGGIDASVGPFEVSATIESQNSTNVSTGRRRNQLGSLPASDPDIEEVPNTENDAARELFIAPSMVAKFSWRNSTHEARIKSIMGKRVTIVFSSDPVEVTLDEGETKTVDLDADGIGDIKVTARRVLVTGVYLVLQDIIAAAPVTPESPDSGMNADDASLAAPVDTPTAVGTPEAVTQDDAAQDGDTSNVVFAVLVFIAGAILLYLNYRSGVRVQ